MMFDFCWKVFFYKKLFLKNNAFIILMISVVSKVLNFLCNKVVCDNGKDWPLNRFDLKK